MQSSPDWDRLRGVGALAGLSALFAVALAAQAHAVAADGGNWLFDTAAGIVACGIALSARRIRTGRAAAAGLAVCVASQLAGLTWTLPGQPAPVTFLALLVLIVRALRTLPPAAAAAVGLASGAIAATAAGAHADVAGPLYWGWGVATTAGLVVRLLDLRRQAGMAAVRRSERTELARELHDSAAHHITAMVIQAQAARVAARSQPGGLDDALAGIESAGSEALAALRRVIGLLRDGGAPVELAAGAPELSALVARFAASGPAVSLSFPEGMDDWPPEVATTVYRVVQEALTNVARHAAGTHSVTVAVEHQDAAVTVEITDDGGGQGWSQQRFPHVSGYGLAGMRERVEALGGALTAGPGAPAGWTVRASLPAGRS